MNAVEKAFTWAKSANLRIERAPDGHMKAGNGSKSVECALSIAHPDGYQVWGTWDEKVAELKAYLKPARVAASVRKEGQIITCKVDVNEAWADLKSDKEVAQ